MASSRPLLPSLLLLSSSVIVFMGSVFSGFNIMLKEHFFNSIFLKVLLVLNYLIHNYVNKHTTQRKKS